MRGGVTVVVIACARDKNCMDKGEIISKGKDYFTFKDHLFEISPSYQVCCQLFLLISYFMLHT
jgi:hypothetical protein